MKIYATPVAFETLVTRVYIFAIDLRKGRRKNGWDGLVVFAVAESFIFLGQNHYIVFILRWPGFKSPP